MRINKLSRELNIVVGKSYLIVNQAKGELPREVMEIIAEDGLELAGTIPEDEAVYTYDLKGQPTVTLDENNPAVQQAFAIFDKVISG